MTSKTTNWCFQDERPIDSVINAVNEVYAELNEDYENYSITDIKSKFENTEAVGLTIRQTTALANLNEKLTFIDKELLSSLNPDYFYTKGCAWDNIPVTPLHSLKAKLLEFEDLLDWLLVSNAKKLKINDTLKTTKDIIKDKLNTLNEIIEGYAKFIFATKLRYLSKKEGLTQAAIAEVLQVRQQTVSEWFQPHKPVMPAIEKCVQLALLFKTSVDFLVRPDCKELEITDDFISKECQLSGAAINTLRSIEDPNIINTLNTLICNYRSQSIDILSAATEYLKMPFEQEMFIFTSAEINHINQMIAESSNLENARFDVKSFTKQFENDAHTGNNQACFGASYDVSNVLLIELNKRLTRLRDTHLQKHY